MAERTYQGFQDFVGLVEEQDFVEEVQAGVVDFGGVVEEGEDQERHDDEFVEGRRTYFEEERGYGEVEAGALEEGLGGVEDGVVGDVGVVACEPNVADEDFVSVVVAETDESYGRAGVDPVLFDVVGVKVEDYFVVVSSFVVVVVEALGVDVVDNEGDGLQ